MAFLITKYYTNCCIILLPNTTKPNTFSNIVGVTSGEIKMIQRDEENPFMFFRVGGQTRINIDRVKPSYFQLALILRISLKLSDGKYLQSEDQTVQCFTGSKEILLMARRLIQINLVTFSMLASMLPHNIIHISYFFTAKPGESLEKVLGIVGYFQLPFIVLFPFLIYKKLDK